MSEAANTCSLVTAWSFQKHALIQGLHCKVSLGVNTCERKSWIVVQAWKASVKLLGTLECILMSHGVSQRVSPGCPDFAQRPQRASLGRACSQDMRVSQAEAQSIADGNCHVQKREN